MLFLFFINYNSQKVTTQPPYRHEKFSIGVMSSYELILPDFPTPFPTTPLIFSQMERKGRATDGKTWKTPFLLIIFAPGVEKTGWKFQAAGG